MLFYFMKLKQFGEYGSLFEQKIISEKNLFLNLCNVFDKRCKVLKVEFCLLCWAQVFCIFYVLKVGLKCFFSKAELNVTRNLFWFAWELIQPLQSNTTKFSLLFILFSLKNSSFRCCEENYVGVSLAAECSRKCPYTEWK